MTPEPAPLDRLLHLVDRAERGALLPAEAAQLRAGIRHLEVTLARVENLAAVWADAPDPLARAMAADLTTTLRGPDLDVGETPTEAAAADRRYWTTRFDKETP